MNAQRSGTKSAAVRMAYLTISRRSRGSFGPNKFVSLEIINDSLHAVCGIIQRYFVARRDIFRDLVRRFALFESFPNDHRGLVQLIVLLGVQVDEYPFTTVKIGNDYMFAWR